MDLSRYRKAFLSAIPAIVATLKVLSDALGDASVSSQEWIAVAVAYLTTFLVYEVPNTRPQG